MSPTVERLELQELKGTTEVIMPAPHLAEVGKADQRGPDSQASARED